ncbi:unnamed protein product [Nesidiocoris tenuis]|uniref:Reverse transcriptase domain-containing protein n=1 Tax=Nesidiocoris tenuis TaxID=355587 RepID=A0A6H5G8T8_9HEMI|nr:unnamed protein product [Nesidiocoris tenuis]
MNDLVVNHSKSAVVVFRRSGGSLPNYYRFCCGSSEIGLVNSYTYLGVIFSSSCLFNKNSSSAVSRGEAASRALLSLVHKLNGCPISSWLNVFNACALSTALYAAEIWGLNLVDELERIQLRAVKSVMLLARNTPDHYVRAELGLAPVKCQLFKQALTWYGKICRMDETRLPKVCFIRLLHLSDSGLTMKYNWASQLSRFFNEIGELELWQGQDVSQITAQSDRLLSSMIASCRERDRVLVERSSFNTYFKLLNGTASISSYLEESDDYNASINSVNMEVKK